MGAGCLVLVAARTSWARWGGRPPVSSCGVPIIHGGLHVQGSRDARGRRCPRRWRDVRPVPGPRHEVSTLALTLLVESLGQIGVLLRFIARGPYQDVPGSSHRPDRYSRPRRAPVNGRRRDPVARRHTRSEVLCVLPHPERPKLQGPLTFYRTHNRSNCRWRCWNLRSARWRRLRQRRNRGTWAAFSPSAF